jgi:hypothetical protein
MAKRSFQAVIVYVVAFATVVGATYTVLTYYASSVPNYGIQGPVSIRKNGIGVNNGTVVFNSNGQGEKQPDACRLGLILNSNASTRLHGRYVSDFLAVRLLEFQFQELFYIWRLELKPSEFTSKIYVELIHLLPDDLLEVDPSVASVSGLKPRWMSGFQEPTRQTPDFFARTITFDSISIRRYLSSPTSLGNVVGITNLSAANCESNLPKIDPTQEATRLIGQATKLSRNRFSKDTPAGGLPLEKDKGDISANETEASVEAWCENDECNRFLISKLEARIGTSLDR